MIIYLFFIVLLFMYVYLYNGVENFRDLPFEAPPYVLRKGMPSTQQIYKSIKDIPSVKTILKDKTLENKTLNYNQILIDGTADLKYYENNMLDQSKINEDAYDIINQIDLVDYSAIETGMDKCMKNCGGTCLELGYTGSATCFPKTKKFDYGTLYKNPTFTYGIDQRKY